MTRVVADTNVYVSALLFGGAPEEILMLARAGAVALYVSPAIRDELAGVLSAKFGWEGPRVHAALALIEGFSSEVHPTKRVTTIKEDDCDNRILECALEADAGVIISGDQHLLKLRAFRGILIVSPRAFLDSIGV